MRKVICLILILMVALALAQLPASAVKLEGGESVSIPAGTTLADDLYAFASKVDVSGKVVGDVIAAGGNVSVSGDVAQSVIATGGNVTLSGKAGDDLMACGGTVCVTGSTVEDATVTGGNVEFAKGSKIGRDVLAAGGTVALNGTVVRNATVAGGQVRLEGVIGGNVEVQAKQLTVGPGAVIKGDLVYTSANKPEISPSAKIMGETVSKPMPARPKPRCLFGCMAAMWFVRFLMLLVAGMVVIALAPRAAEAAADAVFGRFWISLLVGFIVLTVLPIALTIIMCTVIGLPLALIFFAGYLISVYLSRAFVGLAIGRWLFRRLGRESVSPYLGFFVGLLILWLLTAIPIFGWLVHALSLLLGLGGLVATRYKMMKDLRAEGRL